MRSQAKENKATVELHRFGPRGEYLKTLALWQPGNELEPWLEALRYLMVKRGCKGFHIHEAIVRSSSRKIVVKWSGEPVAIVPEVSFVYNPPGWPKSA